MNSLRWCALFLAVLCVLFIATSCGAKEPSTATPTRPVFYTDIAADNNSVIEEALSKFDPVIRGYLASIPILYGDVRTALAQTTYYVKPGKERILVSRDWDKKYGESSYWQLYYKDYGVNPQDSVFSRTFKVELLVHEYLHHAELKKEINLKRFFDEMFTWFLDPARGEPLPEDNYIKYIIFWNLYRPDGFNGPHPRGPGEEEFAYIGEQIANGPIKRMDELSVEIIKYYRGILREEFLIKKRP